MSGAPSPTRVVEPDASRSRELYREAATRYDLMTRALQPTRARAVEALQLQFGQTVLDVGCGTGNNFESLLDHVGPEGRVHGIEPSPEMLELAEQRIWRFGWKGQVRLQQVSVEEAHVPEGVDAVLFSFTHDVMRSPHALDHLLRQVAEGSRVVSAGGKLAPKWALPVNVVARRAARRFVTTLDGYDQPWEHLLPYLESPTRRTTLFGAAFVIAGRLQHP